MLKNTIRRLFGIALILAVSALGTHAVAHWDGHVSDEEHCQVCHIGHAAIPQPTVHVAEQAPAPVARLAPTEDRAPDLEFVRTLSNPRAPPTA